MPARPYPTELEETVQLPSGRTVTLRAIRPDDEARHLDLLHHLSLEDTRWRFFAPVHDMDHDHISRFTCIDYENEMAFIATRAKADGDTETLGVARSALLPAGNDAEFAIIVRSDDKNQGLGWALMQKLMAYLQSRHVKRVIGEVLPDNRGMLAFAHDLGFSSRHAPEDGVTHIWKILND